MADELILPATVKDNFSKPLKDLAERLKNLKPSPNMRAMEKHFVDLRKRIDEAGRAIKDAGSGLVGGLGLGGLSIGALSAAGAMAALGASVKTFATNVVDMRRFSQETGIAAQKLKELKAVSAGLGIDEGALQGGLRFGAANYAALKRGQGNYAEIANLRGGGASIANELRSAKSADDYTERGLAILNRQKTAEQRRVLSEKIFGTEEFASFGAQGAAALAKRRAAARSSIGGQSKDDEANAEKFLDASSKISASIEKLTNAVGGALAPHITQLAEALNKFGNEHMGDVQGFFDGVGKALREHDWKADGVAINTAIEAVKAFFEELNKFKAGADSVADSFHKADVAITKWVEDHAKALIPPNITPQSGAEAGKRLEDATKGKDLSPDANKGIHEATGADGYKPIAYRPGARMAAAGIAGAANSMAVATIAAGVLKGMTDFAATLQGGGDAAGVGGGSGLVQAAYHPGGGMRMGGGGAGGSASITPGRAVVAKGALAKNQKLAYDAAIAEGLSPTAARALVANMSGESLANPADHHWDVKHMSQGIVQWDPGRAAAIQKQFGKLPKDMSVAEQTKAAVWEMKTKYPRTWKALSGSGTASSMIDTLVRDYERPGNPGKAVSQRLGFLAGMEKRLAAQEENDKRGAASKSKARSDAAASKDAANGRVDIHVHSKDQPVDMKTDKSPLFGETKLNRGKSVGLMDI